ncbi:Carboxymuconolactone decarboxylase family protein [Novosphingobium sp. CF614]|uniref:carboxymuconolactone decarboxylase family protein n=1 Tax=Novosphingobium sp. CF614 TaxID=1884364 RepID=UPI0008E55E4F|nr:carboxymuconolactone decarboxylase family protein [Novosphingobium sp. CF614]SFG01201.1 Carboxymuconolactone decarboxylase family protein [Novosphingobium sp. CF614]
MTAAYRAKRGWTEMARASTEERSTAGLQFDPVAREAEILGKPQRLEPLELRDFDGDARSFADEMSESMGNQRGSEISPMYRLFFRHFPLFRCTMDMSVQLLAKGELSARERELIIVRTTWLCGAPNPYGEHVEIGRSIGISEEDLRRLSVGSTAPGWSDHERNMLKAVEDLCERQAVSDEVWDALALEWTDKQQIEFPAIVGQYIASAIMHNTLRTRISERNKGLTQFVD